MGAFDDKPSQREQRRLQEWAKADRQELEDAVRAMLEHRSTRRYLWWLLRVGKAVGQQPFTGNALTTSFGCGEMNVGQQILAQLLESAPDGFSALMKEHSDEQAIRDRQLEELRTGGRDGDGADDRPARADDN